MSIKKEIYLPESMFIEVELLAQSKSIKVATMLKVLVSEALRTHQGEIALIESNRKGENNV